MTGSPTQITVWQTWTANGTWTAPSGLVPGSVQAYTTGESGTGGTASQGAHSGGGSGAGAFAGEPALGGVTPGTVLTITVPQGGTGNPCTITGGAVTVSAAAGSNASGQAAGNGGAAGSNTIAKAGGNGAGGSLGGTANGGGGGGSAGSTGAGGNASASTGGTAGTGAAGPPSLAGATGASGAGSNANGVSGSAPGAGASGGGSQGLSNHTGGPAIPGQAIIVWAVYLPGAGGPLVQARPARPRRPWAYGQATPVTAYTPGPPVPPPPPAYGPLRQRRPPVRRPAAHGTPGVVVPVLPGPPVPPPPPAKGPVRQQRPAPRLPAAHGRPGVWTANAAGIVNQWQATFAQPAVFGNAPPALQSAVIALTPANSVGGGTGTPTAGNWLFCIAGWNQNGLPAATVGDADDIHSWWRPGNETTSTWAVSTPTANTRVSVWYTPNLARAPGDVYAAPSGAMAGMACLVIEVSGLGPWDTVTGISTGYVAASTGLTLGLGAPSGQAFILAAACGDSTAAGQQLAPAGWSALQTVTATNGVDHTCDAVLTSACYTATTAVSVQATATTGTDMGGVIIGVLYNAPSPVPAGANQAWAGRVILEAAFGAGMQTPPDQYTWTALSDNAWTSTAQGWKRFWSWQDRTGIPYALGQLQSSQGTIALDNYDGALSPSNGASPFTGVLSGVPVRLRMALGTVGGTVYNRWYTFTRNVLSWPEKRNKALRGFVEATTSDIWSVMSAAPPTPYRGEVEQDNPGWWWPCDDQPLTGGVLPVTLRNASRTSATTLAITASANGVTGQDIYSSGKIVLQGGGGTDLTALDGSKNPQAVATYTVAQQPGFLFGDPQVSPQSAQTGNPVSAQPGSAAWQQSGAAGNTGSHGWFLNATDTFPSLTAGATVEGWFNYGFEGTAQGYFNDPLGQFEVGAQPYCPLTLFELATATAGVAALQLDINGHLNMLTGSSLATSTTIYSTSDLRSAGWFHVALTLTTTGWTVYLNGGLTAKVTGSATSPSSWSWLLANGDLGSSGGSTLASIQHAGNVYISHLAVYPQVLPAWRILAHYGAAIAGFGALPAPTGLQVSSVAATGSFTPDGTASHGSYAPVQNSSWTFSAVTAAVAGSYTSGPSARAVQSGTGTLISGTWYGAAIWLGWTAVAPLVQVFTAASAAAETEADSACGSGEAFTSGYGSGATATGACHVGAGTGATPPTGASALGDTVGQRIERVLGYGGITYPNRAVDPAPLLVQAALDVGGQQTGASIQNVASSDNGALYVDNNGTLCYRQRPHLAADTVTWQIGMNTAAGQIPFAGDIVYDNDPQRIWTAITVRPYSPDGTSLPDLTPASAAAVTAAQNQYGTRPYQVTSYLQSSAEQQAQANWLFTTFGHLTRRIRQLTVDAASHPAAWGLVLGINVADLVQVSDQPFSAPATTGTYRVSQVTRQIGYGANGSKIEAKAVLTLDPVPASYWT